MKNCTANAVCQKQTLSIIFVSQILAMKELLITICVTLILNPLYAQIKKEYYENGKVKSEGNYENGVAHGLWKYYHTNGKLKSIGQKKKGKLAGSWRVYTKDGKLNSTGLYTAGKKSGTWKVFRPTGELFSRGSYVNGQKEGSWVTYALNGSVDRKSNYSKGKLKDSNNAVATKKSSTDTKPYKNRNLSYTDGPSKNRAVNFKSYLLTQHPTQLKSLKDHKARVIKSQSINIGPYKTFTYSNLKNGKDYLFYVLCENTKGTPTVKVNGTVQKFFYKSNKEITQGDDKCISYYAKKKGVKGARVTFSYSQNTNAQFILIEQERDWKK